MNILHYSLGFPPYRTGGLTKFSMDLMLQQVKEGNAVSLLWPGEILPFYRKTSIRTHKIRDGIGSYEVLNPTPISYDEGILRTDLFMQEGTEEVYFSFLRKLSPDVIHIHTLMGLHKSLLVAAKKLQIHLVFSAHDFFPICSKVTLFRNGGVCSTAGDCSRCASCNGTALSLGKVILLQSRLYEFLKDSSFVKKLRKRHRDAYLSEEVIPSSALPEMDITAEHYRNLRMFYQEMLNQMDVIHFNSSLTKTIYETFLQLDGVKKVQISITHGDIKNNKQVKTFGKELRISYLGPASTAKGYYLLKQALDRLWYDPISGRQDFCLNVFFRPADVPPYLKVHDRYRYDQMDEVFAQTDVLIAPSVLYETFGYTVQEALSYGVPVIVSGNIGAKDIIPADGGIVIADMTAEKLAEAIRKLDTKTLSNMHETIRARAEITDIASMSSQIIRRCYCRFAAAGLSENP